MDAVSKFNRRTAAGFEDIALAAGPHDRLFGEARELMEADLVALADSYVGERVRGSCRPKSASLVPAYGGRCASWEDHYGEVLDGVPYRGCSVSGEIEI